jgi:hypothetical protein
VTDLLGSVWVGWRAVGDVDVTGLIDVLGEDRPMLADSRLFTRGAAGRQSPGYLCSVSALVDAHDSG